MDLTFDERCNGAITLSTRLAQSVTNWADFANAFSAPGGYIQANFQSDAERRRFCDTPQFKQITTTLENLMRKFGMADGGRPTLGPDGHPVIMV